MGSIGGRPRGGQRAQRVGEQVRQILSEFLMAGSVRELTLDRAELVSVTEVRVTSDLSLARVFVSIFPADPAVIEEVMAAFAAAGSRIRSLLGAELRIRRVPELRFFYDESIERGARMEAILAQARAEDVEHARQRGELDEHSEPSVSPLSVDPSPPEGS